MTEVTYVDIDDFIVKAKELPIEDVDVSMMKDLKVLQKSSVVILKINHDYKVLKSKY